MAGAINEVSGTFEAVLNLVAAGKVRVSDHGYDELSNDGIQVRDLLTGVVNALVIEDYPAFGRARPCWCYNLTDTSVRYMSSGVFRGDYRNRLYW